MNVLRVILSAAVVAFIAGCGRGSSPAATRTGDTTQPAAPAANAAIQAASEARSAPPKAEPVPAPKVRVDWKNISVKSPILAKALGALRDGNDALLLETDSSGGRRVADAYGFLFVEIGNPNVHPAETPAAHEELLALVKSQPDLAALLAQFHQGIGREDFALEWMHVGISLGSHEAKRLAAGNASSGDSQPEISAKQSASTQGPGHAGKGSSIPASVAAAVASSKRTEPFDIKGITVSAGPGHAGGAVQCNPVAVNIGSYKAADGSWVPAVRPVDGFKVCNEDFEKLSVAEQTVSRISYYVHRDRVVAVQIAFRNPGQSTVDAVWSALSAKFGDADLSFYPAMDIDGLYVAPKIGSFTAGQTLGWLNRLGELLIFGDANLMTLSTKSSPKSVARVSGGKKEVLWHYELGVKYNEHSQQYTAVGSDSCECLSIVDTSALAALRDDAAKAMQAALADMRAGKQEATKRQATGLKEQAVRDAKAI